MCHAPQCGPIAEQCSCDLLSQCTRQPWAIDELPIRFSNVHERDSYQNSVIHVCDCQVLLEINNRTYLSATADVNSIAFCFMTFIRESNIV